MFTIYKMILPNGFCYIGLTSRKLQYRISKHKSEIIHNKYNHPLYNALKNYLWEDIIIQTLFVCDNKEEAEQLEIKMIEENQPNYNLSIGGKNTITEESVSKIKKANTGKIRTEEQRKRYSEANYNRHKNKPKKEKLVSTRKKSGESEEKRQKTVNIRINKMIDKIVECYNETMTLKELANKVGVSIKTITSHANKWRPLYAKKKEENL